MAYLLYPRRTYSRMISMPFVSESQRGWMWANKPEMAKEWQEHTPKGKKLPKRVKKEAEDMSTSLCSLLYKSASDTQNAGIPARMIRSFLPGFGERRESFTPDEEQQIDEKSNRWMPDIVQTDSTPIPNMMSSPKKQGILAALLAGIPAAGVGYMASPAGYKGIAAGVGGGLAGLLAGLARWHGQNKEHSHIQEVMRRLPSGATKRDYDIEEMLSDALAHRFGEEKLGGVMPIVVGGLGGLAAGSVLNHVVRPHNSTQGALQELLPFLLGLGGGGVYNYLQNKQEATKKEEKHGPDDYMELAPIPGPRGSYQEMHNFEDRLRAYYANRKVRPNTINKMVHQDIGVPEYWDRRNREDPAVARPPIWAIQDKTAQDDGAPDMQLHMKDVNDQDKMMLGGRIPTNQSGMHKVDSRTDNPAIDKHRKKRDSLARRWISDGITSSSLCHELDRLKMNEGNELSHKANSRIA